MSELVLTPGQRRRLQRQLKAAQDARVYRRTLALLEVERGTPISRLAQTLGVTRQSIYNWVEDYAQAHDPADLHDQSRSGRPSSWTEELQGRLRSLLQRPPNRLGYFAVNWTVPLLQEELGHSAGQRLSEDTIRRELRRLGYVWKRGRYVLDPDPELEKKTADPQENTAVAAPERGAGRRRDGPAAVPAAARGLGEGRPAFGSALVGAERAAGDLRLPPAAAGEGEVSKAPRASPREERRGHGSNRGDTL
jgi:transposase